MVRIGFRKNATLYALSAYALLAAAALFFGLMAPVNAQMSSFGEVEGTVYEIRRIEETKSDDGHGSSGTSYDRSIVIERVLGVDADGLTLEYDLPARADQAARDRQWTFPLRVLRPASGPTRLLDRQRLEARIASWLKRWKVSRAGCGHYGFTWNAFKIECDPDSALDVARAYDLRADPLDEGGRFRHPNGLGDAPFQRSDRDQGGAVLTAELPINPAAMLEQEAEVQRIVAEIFDKPIEIEAAWQALRATQVTGTIAVRIEVDRAGGVTSKTVTQRTAYRAANGKIDNRLTTTTWQRRKISEASPRTGGVSSAKALSAVPTHP